MIPRTNGRSQNLKRYQTCVRLEIVLNGRANAARTPPISTMTTSTASTLIAAPTDEDRVLAAAIIAEIDTRFISTPRTGWDSLADVQESLAQLIANHVYAVSYHDAQSIVNDYEERIATMTRERELDEKELDRLNLEVARFAEEQRERETAQ